MKICIVSNFKPSGYGESTRPGQMAKYLHQMGHDILHICDTDETIDGIKHLYIARNTWQAGGLNKTVAFIKNYLTIALFNPDFIYVHQFNNAEWAVQTRLFKGRRIVFDAHTSSYLEHLHFKVDKGLLDEVLRREGTICRKADFIIAASAETKEVLQTQYNLEPNKLDVAGNATNIKPVETLAPLNTTEFTILATLPQDGFESNKMALDMLLAIATKVYSINSDVKFHVVGGGKMPPSPPPNVIYRGYVPDLREAILNATICMMAFPEDAVCGGARNKFCDYIALAKTVATTPEGLRGMEILEHNKNCVVANDVDGLVAVITDLAHNPAKIEAIEREVFTIRHYFNWADRAKKVESIFKRLLN